MVEVKEDVVYEVTDESLSGSVYQKALHKQTAKIKTQTIPENNIWKSTMTKAKAMASKYYKAMWKIIRVGHHRINTIVINAKKKITQSPIGEALCKLVNICSKIDEDKS